MEKKLGRGLGEDIDDLGGLVAPAKVPVPPPPQPEPHISAGLAAALPPQAPITPPPTPKLGRGFSDLLEEINAQRGTEPTPVDQSAGPPVSTEQRAKSQESNKSVPVTSPSQNNRDSAAASPANTDRAVVMIEVNKIFPNRFQPRKTFDGKALEELANSIKTSGVIQPMVLRPQTDGRYEIVTGERRWRACSLLGLGKVPAILQDIDDRQMLEWALVENIQRQDLNPIERARAYKDLISGFGLTQEEIAKRVGLERSTVANFIRLLELPGQVQDEIARGGLSPTHALPLLSLDSPELQVKLALRAKKQGMTVRRLNYVINWIKKRRGQQQSATPESNRAQLVLKEIEDRLRAKLGCKVSISSPDQKRGKVTLEFFSPEGFQRIIDSLDK